MTSPTEPAAAPDDVLVPEQAPGPGVSEGDIRDLAAQLMAPPLSFDPSTIRKGVVAAVSAGDASNAPTISVTLSGDNSVVVDGVRLAADYSPNVGDTVILIKQGANLFAAFRIAEAGSIVASSAVGGWQLADLGSGFGHNGNAQGSLMYRRVLEDGSWKMQWKGGVSISGSQIAVCSVGSDYTPTGKRTLCAAREQAGGSNVINVDFLSSGAVNLVGATSAPLSATLNDSAHSHGGGTGSVGSHYHQYVDAGYAVNPRNSYSAGGHDHGIAESSHNHGSHHHDVNPPGWVSFNGLEYFL
ncbi:hypothetical protein [Streptomyces sp. I8-5]|uniref:hypothetical protein n=1 Tax=Streptomyces sp. I8-5 TaxID=3104277 RepID=UPI00386546E5